MAEHDRTVPFYKEVQGCILPGGFSTEAFESALKYVPRSDDLFVVTYPKCGTTWVQQILFLIYNKGVPGKNLSEVFLRTPFMDMAGIESAEQMTRPGAIKVHLPFNLTPYSPEAKYLYVARNPKDVCVSYYHHMITDPVFTFQEGSFDRFFEDFVTGKLAYNDYFNHVLKWYEHRNDPNVMFVVYEELKDDPKKVILKIAKFMGEEWFDMLASDSEMLENVVKFSGVDYMKTAFNNLRPKDNNDDSYIKQTIYPGLKHAREFSRNHFRDGDEQFKFVRQGKVGTWRDVLSKDQLTRMDARIEELNGTDLYTFWKSIGCI